MTRGRFLLVLLVASLALAAPLALAMQSKSSVKVTENDSPKFKLTALPSKAAKGRVTFTVKNIGHLDHEFIVLKTNIPVGKLPVKGAKAVLKGTIEGTISKFKPGQTKKLTVKLPAGRYILLCNLPAHYQAGQRAAFKVR